MDYLAIIDSCNNIQATIDTVSSLESQTVKPKKIIVFHQPNYSNHPEDIADAIKYTSVKWRVNAFTEYQKTPIDKCIIGNKNSFYCSFRAGIKLPDNIFKQINDHLKKGIQFALIIGDQKQGDIIPYYTYQNSTTTFNELIKIVDMNNTKFGKNIRELCPNFPSSQPQ